MIECDASMWMNSRCCGAFDWQPLLTLQWCSNQNSQRWREDEAIFQQRRLQRPWSLPIPGAKGSRVRSGELTWEHFRRNIRSESVDLVNFSIPHPETLLWIFMTPTIGGSIFTSFVDRSKLCNILVRYRKHSVFGISPDRMLQSRRVSHKFLSRSDAYSESFGARSTVREQEARNM